MAKQVEHSDIAGYRADIAGYRQAISHRPNETFFPFVNFLDSTPAGKNFKKVSRYANKTSEDVSRLGPSALAKTRMANIVCISLASIGILMFLISMVTPWTSMMLASVTFSVVFILAWVIVPPIFEKRPGQLPPQQLLEIGLAEIAGELTEWYYDLYRDKKELYFISIKFMKLLIETTVDVSPRAKRQFLEKYQDKSITQKCDQIAKKIYKL